MAQSLTPNKEQKQNDTYEITNILENLKAMQMRQQNVADELAKSYQKLKDDKHFSTEYNEVIAQQIKISQKIIGDTSVKDMTVKQLNSLYASSLFGSLLNSL